MIENTQTVLFGNGLNRLTPGNPSWEDLLTSIAKENLEKDIPNTLRYEAIIVKQPYREEPARLITADGKVLLDADGKVLYAAGEKVEDRLKKDIAERVCDFAPNVAYDIVADLPVEHFITTNYDNTLLKAKGILKKVERNRQERIYSIRRRYEWMSKNGLQTYWPIHGNVDSPSSIMLGFDHYCGSLSKIESYVKGNYELPSGERIPSMARKLQMENKPALYSWIDLFFFSDVHIIGLDLAYEEMDLWWILNKRRRIKQKGDVVINNRIIYYPVAELSRDKRQLLNGFDVEIIDLENYSTLYMSRYKKQFDNIRANISA